MIIEIAKTIIFACIFLFLAYLLFQFVKAMIWGAPWVPTPRKIIDAMLESAELSPGKIVIDPGCGDGRIIARATREYKTKSIGFELFFIPYIFAKTRSWMNPGMTVRFENAFTADYSMADVIICFTMPEFMNRMYPVWRAQLKPGAKVISYAFNMKDMEPARVIQLDKKALGPIYVYEF